MIPLRRPPERRLRLKLYSFWRSSCAQRVRIALNLEGLEYEYKPVNLFAKEQSDPEFEKLNPIKYVPALVIADSFAILLYLEDMYPQHPLLPKDPVKRALNIQIASIVGSSIQPLQNYPVTDFIEEKFDSNEAINWIQHHINRGFTALEKLLKGCSTKYATGNEIQLGDVFLEPQIYAGVKRFGINMSSRGFMKHTWSIQHFKLRCQRSNQMHLPPELGCSIQKSFILLL